MDDVKRRCCVDWELIAEEIPISLAGIDEFLGGVSPLVELYRIARYGRECRPESKLSSNADLGVGRFNGTEYLQVSR
jgi:hypothetical protein